MIVKKICMLGAFAVGKTSLVSRYVQSVFSEKYHTSLGVKVDKKELQVDGTNVKLMVWDMAGEDDFAAINLSYLRGAEGYLLVCDGTRSATLTTAVAIQARVCESFPNLPFLLLLNKADMHAEWEIKTEATDALLTRGWSVLQTSAKLGQGVEESFVSLTRAVLK